MASSSMKNAQKKLLGASHNQQQFSRSGRSMPVASQNLPTPYFYYLWPVANIDLNSTYRPHPCAKFWATNFLFINLFSPLMQVKYIITMQTVQIITTLHIYCDLHFDQQHNLLRPLFVHFTMTQKIKRIIKLLSPSADPIRKHVDRLFPLCLYNRSGHLLNG